MSEPIVVVQDLCRHFTLKGGWGQRSRTLRAVQDLNFSIDAGETLGLVGESGSGKSTTGRLLVGLLPATSGSITLFGHPIVVPGGKQAMAPVRRRVQFVFQDPMGSLDPRMRIEDAIAEPLDIAGGLTRGERSGRVRELVALVGLPRDCGERFPHEFSGGQRQRIGIARALMFKPKLLIADEPVSALDVSIQAQILELLDRIQRETGVAMVFITHDLRVASQICDEIAVMHKGRIVEQGPPSQIFFSPRADYTRELVAAIPGERTDARPAVAAESR